MKEEIKNLYLKGLSRKEISSKMEISLKATQSIIDRNKQMWEIGKEESEKASKRRNYDRPE